MFRVQNIFRVDNIFCVRVPIFQTPRLTPRMIRSVIAGSVERIGPDLEFQVQHVFASLFNEPAVSSHHRKY